VPRARASSRRDHLNDIPARASARVRRPFDRPQWRAMHAASSRTKIRTKVRSKVRTKVRAKGTEYRLGPTLPPGRASGAEARLMASASAEAPTRSAGNVRPARAAVVGASCVGGGRSRPVRRAPSSRRYCPSAGPRRSAGAPRGASGFPSRFPFAANGRRLCNAFCGLVKKIYLHSGSLVA
jgi:hypothetical protein